MDETIQGRHGPRSRNGCWTCRERKVKCDENRPTCLNCNRRRISCDYVPRARRPRRKARPQPSFPQRLEPRTDNSPSQTLSPYTDPGSPLSAPLELAHDLRVTEWPLPMTQVDRRALYHYTQNILPRMILRPPRWSSYGYVLQMCGKNSLLAHLILAFSIRDMAGESDAELTMSAFDHYQTALSLFIQHLRAPERCVWITFPALWFFIHYEQQYGDDPSVLQKHLEGVKNIVALHGTSILPESIGGRSTSNGSSTNDAGIPWKMIDRTLFWTIEHDSNATFFGFGGGLLDLLVEQYPGSIDRIMESSTAALEEAHGPQWPIEEKIWETQLRPIEVFVSKLLRLRRALAKTSGKDPASDAQDLISLGREIQQLREEYSSLILEVLSSEMPEGSIAANNCIPTAHFYAIVCLHDRRLHNLTPRVAVSQTLHCCAKLAESTPPRYLWRIAWPLFIAAMESDDLVHQAWVLERFRAMQDCGENIRRARVFIEGVLAERRKTGRVVDYMSWLEDSPFEKFVL